MKKLLALLLAAAMLLTFAACASKPAETQTPAETTTEEPAAPAAETETKTEEAPAAETTDGKTYKVAMICDSSINDGGWGAACQLWKKKLLIRQMIKQKIQTRQKVQINRKIQARIL